MGLDVGSKVNIKSIAGLEHLQAIPANNGPINDGGGYRDVVKLLPNESFVKLHDRRTGVEIWKEGISLLRTANRYLLLSSERLFCRCLL